MSKIIVSFSGGKDSTCMLLKMLELGEHIDEVVYFDTGWEFPQMYEHVYRVRSLVRSHGIKFTSLETEESFDYYMFDKVVNEGKPNEHKGYSWCGTKGCRWGTRLKIKTINNYFKHESDYIQCIGIAKDETERIYKEQNPNKRFPLVEWGMTEAECLQYCYDRGYYWGGLYENLDRVSCRFCGLKNLKELRYIYNELPEVWDELKEYQNKTDIPFRGDGSTVMDLEKRFALEKGFQSMNKSIRSRDFHDALKRALT